MTKSEHVFDLQDCGEAAVTQNSPAMRTPKDCFELLQTLDDGAMNADLEGNPPLTSPEESALWLATQYRLVVQATAAGPFEQSALASCACNQVDRRKRFLTLRLLLASGADSRTLRNCSTTRVLRSLS